MTHHGAGSSGLSFALFALEIRKALPLAGVLSLDARGHGETTIRSSTDDHASHALNLSRETLSLDLFDVIDLTRRKLAWPELPSVVLIGHSLGGAVVTELASKGTLGSALLGYGVLDVVEGECTRVRHLAHHEVVSELRLYQALLLMLFKACTRICQRDRKVFRLSSMV